MSTIMIMGAGIYQVPLIKKAQQLGHTALVVSYPGPYPGLSLADEALLIDTTDKDAVLDAARARAIDGIVTTGTDVAVRSLGHVCDALGLPGVSAEAARMLTDKAEMKRAFAAGSAPTSAFEVVSTYKEACSAAASLGYPVMIKACDVSGSRGITKVENAEGIRAAYDAARAATHTDHLLVERFVPGCEIGVDGFMAAGSMELFAPHAKFTFRTGGVTIPAGHAFPLSYPDELLTRIREAIERGCAACGLTDGAFNSDVIITPSGEVSILELGGRCGATCIPELIGIHTGIDYYEQMIRSALGLPVDLTARAEPVPCMAKLLFSPRDGVVQSIDHEAIGRIADAYRADITLDVREGDRIHAVHDGTDRYGSIVMPCAHENDLDRALASLRRAIEVV